MNIRSLLLLIPVLLALASCSSSSNTNGSPPGVAPVATTISQIQGDGATSPLNNTVVSVSGVVGGDFQDNDADTANNLGGFFLQSSSPDADPATSEGIFVFDGTNAGLDVAVGDVVLVEGTVREHQGETRLLASTVNITGADSVQAVDVNLPANLEHYEGMLVRFPQALSVTGLFELERFGSVQLVAGNRPFTFTNQNLPDVSAYAAHRADFAARSILLDDGLIVQSVVPIRYLPGTLNVDTIRGGDSMTGLTGNLRHGRGDATAGAETYRLMPTIEPQFDARNPRPALPARADALRIAGFNTLNFFSTIDSGADTCGPAQSGGCRGADSTAELERQLGKLVTTLNMLDADVIGLMEIENNAGVALQLLIDRLNSVSSDIYDYIDTGAIGTSVITNALIYRTSTVSPVGGPALLNSAADPRFDGQRNRQSLAHAFSQTSDGAIVSVVVNHLKSKGSPCDDTGDPNRNDGQGNCNQTRTEAAAALAGWVANDPTNSGDFDYLVIGDFNAYVFEDPLTALDNGGLSNLVQASVGGETYSSVFAGEYGALDHALASASLLPQVRVATDWHINADEPVALDYNLDFGRDPELFDAATPYRSSDHDPIVVDLQLDP